MLTFVDVTMQREATLALRTSVRRLNALLESVPDAPFAADDQGTLTYVSPRIRALAGVAPDTLIGRTLWHDMIHPDDRAYSEAAWIDASTHGTAYQMRHRLSGPDGAWRWMITRAHRVFAALAGS